MGTLETKRQEYPALAFQEFTVWKGRQLETATSKCDEYGGRVAGKVVCVVRARP